jgi:hypothetical protein
MLSYTRLYPFDSRHKCEQIRICSVFSACLHLFRGVRVRVRDKVRVRVCVRVRVRKRARTSFRMFLYSWCRRIRSPVVTYVQSCLQVNPFRQGTNTNSSRTVFRSRACRTRRRPCSNLAGGTCPNVGPGSRETALSPSRVSPCVPTSFRAFG